MPDAEHPQQMIDISNADSFHAFYERSHRMVFRYISGIFQAPTEEIEDLTAETFIKAWKGRKNFVGSTQGAKSWVFRIARNLVIDQFRKQKHQALPIDIVNDHHLAVHPDFDQALDQKEQLTKIFKSMESLKTHHREMIVLRYMLGWKVKEIAEHMEMEENTVSVNIRRSLQRIRQNWSDD